jgi:2-dehydropantoate 2-reductase
MGRPVRVRLLVAGAGAVGGFLAARFLGGGHDVTVLVRPRRAAQILNLSFNLRVRVVP